MNIDLEIVRDGKPITVTVDCQQLKWLGNHNGWSVDPAVFDRNDPSGELPLTLTSLESDSAYETAQAIWEANEGAQAAEEHRIEAQTLAYEARRDRDEERFGE